jgi:hypothetical protein
MRRTLDRTTRAPTREWWVIWEYGPIKKGWDVVLPDAYGYGWGLWDEGIAPRPRLWANTGIFARVYGATYPIARDRFKVWVQQQDADIIPFIRAELARIAKDGGAPLVI